MCCGFVASLYRWSTACTRMKKPYTRDSIQLSSLIHKRCFYSYGRYKTLHTPLSHKYNGYTFKETGLYTVEILQRLCSSDAYIHRAILLQRMCGITRLSSNINLRAVRESCGCRDGMNDCNSAASILLFLT